MSIPMTKRFLQLVSGIFGPTEFRPGISLLSEFVAGVVINDHVELPIVVAGNADALPLVGTVIVSTAGVDAMTLPTPTPGIDGGNDGNYLQVVSATAQAHTITTPSNVINGNKHVATFAAAVGNNALFYAYNGIWYLVSQVGITLS